jgi:hypothetical protein
MTEVTISDYGRGVTVISDDDLDVVAEKAFECFEELLELCPDECECEDNEE